MYATSNAMMKQRVIIECSKIPPRRSCKKATYNGWFLIKLSRFVVC